MKKLYLISIIFLVINALNAQNLTKGFKLINKGKTLEAKEFFLENKNLCLSKAGLLKIAIENYELYTLIQLNDAYSMVNEFKVCYNSLSKKEKNKYLKYITKHDAQDIYNAIEEKYYYFSIFDNKETTFLAYINNYPTGKYTKEANESIAFLKAKEKNSKESYNNYLDNYPSGVHKNKILALIAKIYFDETKNINPEIEFQKHLSIYPNGYYKEEVFALIEELYFDKALDANSGKLYMDYLNRYPNGVYREKALYCIEAIRGRAIVKIDYPKSVRCDDSYSWETTFTEIGGYISFVLKAEDFYIQAPNGSKYSNDWTNKVIVKPGDSATIEYWCSCSSKWDGGFFHCVWNGEDEKGNIIKIVQEVWLDK